MAKPSSLNAKLVEWLKTHLPAFFKISEASNRAPWLAELVETAIEKFSLPFANDTKTLQDYRVEIPRWFYNQAGSERRKRMRLLCSESNIDLSSATKPSKSLKLDFGVSHVPSARVIFGQKQTESINAIANARRTAAGESHKTHVIHWNNVLTEEWKNLPDEECQRYYDEAEERKSKLLGPPSEEQIYSNQERFAAALQKSLQDYLGFDHGDQIGEAALHVQGVYRGEGDYMKSFSLVLLPPGADNAEKFNTTAEYVTKFLNPWNDYGLKVLAGTAYPRNELSHNETSFSDTNLSYDSEQAPLLPESPNDTAVLRMTLERYILESWDHHWEGRDGKPNFSWCTFSCGFILPSCLPEGIVVENPSAMGTENVVTWYDQLYTLQQRLLESGELQQFFRGHKHLKSLLSTDADSTAITRQMNHSRQSGNPIATPSTQTPRQDLTSIPPKSPLSLQFTTSTSPLTEAHVAPVNSSRPGGFSQEPESSDEGVSSGDALQNTIIEIPTLSKNVPHLPGEAMPAVSKSQSVDRLVTASNDSNVETGTGRKRSVDNVDDELPRTARKSKKQKNTKSVVEDTNLENDSRKAIKTKKRSHESIDTAPATESGPRRSTRIPKKKFTLTSDGLTVIPTATGGIIDSPALSITDPNAKPASQKPGRPRGSRNTWAIMDDNGRIIKTG